MTRLAETIGGPFGGSTALPVHDVPSAPVPAPRPVHTLEPTHTLEPVHVPAPVVQTPAGPAAGHGPAGGAQRYGQFVRECLELAGARGAAVFDVATGELLAGAANDASLDLAAAARNGAELVRAELTTMKSLGLDESMHDILATFSDSFHILGSMTPDNTVFAFLAVNNKSQMSLVRLRFTKLRDHTA